MSSAANPRKIDLRKFFSQQREYRTSFALDLFPRLQDLLADNLPEEQDELEIDLNFLQDPQGDCFIRGSIQTKLQLACQRCLNSVPYQLDSKLNVQVLKQLEDAGDRELDADELEVVVSENGQLDLLELIEDEVILSLPIVIYHETADCNQDLTAFKASEEQKDTGEGRKPFAELEGLKQQLQEEKQKLKAMQNEDKQSE